MVGIFHVVDGGGLFLLLFLLMTYEEESVKCVRGQMTTHQARWPNPLPETVCFQLSLEQLLSKVNSHQLFGGRLLKIMSKKINMMNEPSLEKGN